MSSSNNSHGNSSRWVKCISTQGNIRGVAIQATDLVRQTAARHQVRGEAAQRLGEALMGALLMSSYCKSKERINLNIQGSGLIKQALIDAHPDGTVRGYVVERGNQNTDQMAAFRTAHEHQGPWGEGLLSVLRTKNQEKEQPYIGTVPLLTGHLAKDLTFYWMQSEQVPSAVGLAVSMNGEEVEAAGGFLVQALPGASAQEVRAIEGHIQEIQSLAESLRENSEPVSLLSQIFQSTAFLLLEEKPLIFSCNCSWERVERALTLVGVVELQAMLEEDHKASVRCDFCTKEYTISADDLRRMIEETQG